MKQLIGLEEILRLSWKTAVNEWKPVLKFLLPAIIIPALSYLALGLAYEAGRYTALAVLFAILGTITGMYFGVALMKYLVDFVFGVKRSPWPNTAEFLGVFVIQILYALIVLVGFIFFIIPGIWLGMLLAFSAPIYLHEKTTVFGALKKSYALVSGRWWAAFIRILIPNTLWQIGVYTVMFFTVVMLTVFGAAWVAIGSVLEPNLSMETMRAVNIFGGILSIVAFILIIAIEIVVGVAVYIAQMSIMLETYKSLEKTK